MNTQFRILIANDQSSVLRPIEYFLSQMAGTEVYTAGDGRTAVELAIRYMPHLVLMDVMMPNMDGVSACRHICDGWGEHQGRIWLIATRGSNLDVDAARDAGAERFITEPFDPDELVGQVAEAKAEISPPAGASL